MREIKTKFGSLYFEKACNNEYRLLDSDKRYLLSFNGKKPLLAKIKLIKASDDLSQWLNNYDNVCWGTLEQIKDFVKDYAEINGRKFDENFFNQNFNRVGDTYIFFEYSECYRYE